MVTATQVRGARDRAGLTQTEAAGIKGWTRDYWAKLEAGQRTVDDREWAHWLHLAGLERLPFQRSN